MINKFTFKKLAKIIYIYLFTWIYISTSFSFEMPKIKIFDWNGVEVVYLPDNKMPTYNILIYFADGALSDGKIKGKTSWTLDNLGLGTTRYSRKDISDILDYYGTSWGANVFHEYSTYSISGLSKDLVPTLKKVCHLFKRASFPRNELLKEKRRSIISLKNIVTNHQAVASRAFRQITLSGTPFKNPTSGYLKDIYKINKSILIKHLDYFNTRVKKRIYIKGPKSILIAKNILKNDCEWNGQANFVRAVKPFKVKTQTKSKIYFIRVPRSNQAQIMIGGFISQKNIIAREESELISKLLGQGGFASLLMKKLRVENALTYSARSMLAFQKYYGRNMIMTFTKNSNVEKLLKVTHKVVDNIGNGLFSLNYFNNAKKSLKGSFPFQFENSQKYLFELMFLRHLGYKYSFFEQYLKNIDKLDKTLIVQKFKKIFAWNKQDIVIVGTKKLYTKLKKTYPHIKIYSYKKFL